LSRKNNNNVQQRQIIKQKIRKKRINHFNGHYKKGRILAFQKMKHADY